jgi:hypothetical protein
LKLELIIWYVVSTAVLAYFLYKPVNKFIYVKRIRRAEQKLGRDTTEEEKNAIAEKTSRFALGFSIIFSILFNQMLMGKYFIKK